MRFKHIIVIVSALALSCEKSIEELNENPNSPTSATYDLILTGVEVGNAVLQTGELVRKTGIFSGQYTGLDRAHLVYNTYNVGSSSFNTHWNEVFVDVVSNSRVAEAVALEQGVDGVGIGIIKVLRAMALGTATSLWGDIPFDDAGMPEIEYPSFELQTTAYEKVQNLLDEAILDLSKGSGRPPSGSDIHFDGSPSLWIAAANTLKARYYLQVKDYANANSYAQLGIKASSENFVVPHGTSNNDANLTYQFFEIGVRGSDLIVSDFFISLLNSGLSNPVPANYRGNSKTDESARYSYFFRTANNVIIPNTSNGIAAPDNSALMLSFAENQLILAETNARQDDLGNALAALNAHRLELQSQLTAFGNAKYEAYTLSDFESGGIENLDGLSVKNALLREILEERYISLFNTPENFSDLRRTYREDNIRVAVIPNIGNDLPQRFLYPQTEIDRNINVPSPLPGFFDPTPINQ